MRPSKARLEALEARLLEVTGCTRLCVVLALIGLGLSTAAGLSTYHLVHTPMLSVGSAMVSHHAAANCAAINRVMAGLALTRLDSLVGGHAGTVDESGTNDALVSFGVLNLATGALEDLHLNHTDAASVRRQLQRIPLTSAARPESLPLSAEVETVLEQHSCKEFSFSLRPGAVRLHPVLPSPGEGPRLPASGGHSAGSNQVFAFLHGPWRQGDVSRVAFALVDLAQLAELESGHQHGPGSASHIRHGHLLQDRLWLLPVSDLRSRRTLLAALPELERPNTPLTDSRVIPFANRLLVFQLEIDQRSLTRSTRRAAVGVFLMGLLGTCLVVLISRTSQLKLRRLNQALKRESRTDGLTQTANRRAWDEALAQADWRRLRHGECYGLIVVDLDDFKGINDRLGHKRGDETLEQAARSLARCLRSTDLLARVGGDEFAILLCQPQASGLQNLIERLQASLTANGIQASIGGAINGPEDNLEATWDQADAAMYRRKRR